MKVTNKGFEITDICEAGGTLRSDGERLRIDEGPGAQILGLSADDVTKLIEALTEARRLMTGGVTAIPPRPRRLKDTSDDIWFLDANGETYTCHGQGGDYAGWTRASLDKFYGRMVELPD